jgi:pimeloyl-ACP methyl ester carboxylesterase
MADSLAYSSARSEKTLVHWLFRVALMLGALAVSLVLVGALYQFIGTWHDAQRFAQQGRSVQVGPIKLNIDCTGERSGAASPEVILDSGMGVPAIGWTAVQPEVAKFARVCSYDRAGYGWSEAGPEPRTSLQAAKELNALLNTAGEKAPYILVGHSLGGFNVRVFTKLYPTDVVGVVLVDGSSEDEDKRINELVPADVVKQEESSDLWNARVNGLLSPFRVHLGIERLQVDTGWGNPSYGLLAASRSLSKEYRQELLYLRQQRKFQDAVVKESQAFAESGAQARAAGNLGDRPLIVLTAGKPYPPDPLLSKAQMDRQNDLWINDLQAQETRLSTRGKQIVVPDSGHQIPFHRPDAIVSAIRQIYREINSR